MLGKYLGDSYDIVKRFWAERLGSIAPLYAHSKFVATPLRPAFEKMVNIPILDPSEPRAEAFGLLLDPHTGIPLPTTAMQKATPSHAPLSFIVKELQRLSPKYLVCFDQSHDRSSSLGLAEQHARKQAELLKENISSFYYVSHAPFLFVSREVHVLDLMRSRLVDSGIPHSRFVP